MDHNLAQRKDQTDPKNKSEHTLKEWIKTCSKWIDQPLPKRMDQNLVQIKDQKHPTNGSEHPQRIGQWIFLQKNGFEFTRKIGS